MASPTFVAVGTPASTSGGAGTSSPTWPTHLVNDVGLLFVETFGSDGAPAAPSGWTEAPFSPFANTTSTRLSVFYRRATSTSESAPGIPDPGDHCYAVIGTFRGCVTTGSPIGTYQTTASSGVGPTLNLANTARTEVLMVFAMARALDASGASVASWTSGTFPVITEQFDDGTADGNGGGIAFATAPLVAALALADAGATVSVSQTSTNVAAACFSLIGVDSVLSHPTPRFRGTGTPGASAAGDVTPSMPAHATNDILILAIETPTGVAAPLTTANGFALIGFQDSAAATGTRLTMYWCRATSGSMTAPVVTFVSDHVIAGVSAWIGCIETGDPWDLMTGDSIGANSTAVSVPGGTTTVPSTFVLACCAHGVDTSSSLFGTWVNADLEFVTQRVTTANTVGNGGGFAITSGVKGIAGAFGATTNTLSTTSGQARMTIALRPPRDIVVDATVGAFTHTGQDATIGVGRALSADVAAFTHTGQNATIGVGRVLVADVAAFSNAGQAAEIVYTPIIPPDPSDPLPGTTRHLERALRRVRAVFRD